jgi:DNA-binding LacI/PurR family transcriptional regulator
MKRQEKKPGRELSLVSWDDDDLNEIMGINTVVQPMEAIGQIAADRLFRMIENPSVAKQGKMKITMDTVYAERSSVRRMS